MTDVEICNEGKVNLIESFNQEADSTEIFSLRALKPKTFLKHRLNLSSPCQSISPVFVYQDIYNKGYDFFIGNMSLSFNTSPITGCGTAAFCDYLGYAAINRITIKVGDAEFMFDGEYFFNKVKALPMADQILADAGHNDDCRRVSKSVDVHEEIKPSQKVKVLLPLPFGSNFPKNLLPIALNDKIRVEIIMRHVRSLVNCEKVSNLSMNDFHNFNLSIELYTRKSGVRPVYEPRIDLPSVNMKTVTSDEGKDTIEVRSSRFFSISQKCPLSDKLYPALINNWKNEEDVVAQFLDFLLVNLLYVVPDDKKTIFLESFPPSAKLVEVVNGEAIIRTNETYQQKRIVTVSIKDIPANHTLFYHTNLLTITKCCKDGWEGDFNISEKIISVLGYYDHTLKQIVTTKVNHILSSQHASIPLDVFTTLGEDNRKKDSESYNIKTYFTNGPNIFKPQAPANISVYDGSTLSPEFVIYHETNGDSLSKIQAYSPHEQVIEFSHPQNDSRFTFKNINRHEFTIVVNNTPFEITKSEIINQFKHGKSFREPRHKEEGFESLYPTKSYRIVEHTSSQISQNVTSSGDKISSYLQTV